jgi:hypothetical protein
MRQQAFQRRDMWTDAFNERMQQAPQFLGWAGGEIKETKLAKWPGAKFLLNRLGSDARMNHLKGTLKRWWWPTTSQYEQRITSTEPLSPARLDSGQPWRISRRNSQRLGN